MVSLRQIAERFIQLYWPQALPYGTGRANTSPGILVQNNGVQATVVSAIVAFRYCLRRFPPLVQQLTRSHWVEYIKRNRRNAGILGQADDLEDFLFAASRQSLLVMGQVLRQLDGSQCFYCAQALAEADVDHFVPFSQYPRDLAHNFVLSHPTCNRSKSNTLAAGPHLERWLERIGRHADALQDIGMAAGMLADAQVSRKIAAWGYTAAIARGRSGWLAPGRYETIDQRYSAYFMP